MAVYRHMSYKICVVPRCGNTTIKTPDKLFIHVPQSSNMRQKWLQLARRDFGNMLPKYTMYFCEDHFDLMKDMENYMRFKVMGHIGQIRMKANCLPSKFDCQQDRGEETAIPTNTPESMMTNNRRETLIQEVKRATQEPEKAPTPSFSDTTNTVMEEIKTEIPDYVEFSPESDLSAMVKLEYPLNEDDDQIKIEEITLQPYIYATTTPCEALGLSYENECDLMKYECILCDERFDSAELCKLHCELCNGYKLNSDPLTVSHNSNNKLYRCDVCDALFYTKKRLKIHWSTHTGLKQHKCAVCEKIFLHTTALQTHLATHTKDYECNVCDKKFFWNTSLMLHKREHSGERPFGCVTCGKKFLQRYRLARHEATHANKKAVYKCECGVEFKTMDKLQRHKKIRHENQNKCGCGECDMSFEQIDELAKHQGKLRAKCGVCGKTFAWRHLLESHKLMHSKTENSVSCEVCFRSFTDAEQLLIHQDKLHTTRSRYKCEECPKSFSELPYKCESCEATFKRRRDLKLHKSVTHLLE